MLSNSCGGKTNIAVRRSADFKIVMCDSRAPQSKYNTSSLSYAVE